MKYALVTGGGKGLGKGFVEFLSDNKYFVFAGVREIKPEHQDRDNLKYLNLDVSDDSSILACFDKVSEITEHLNLLVNNAGVNKDSATDGHMEKVNKISKLERKYLLEMFNVNSVAPLLVIKTFLPLLNSNPCFVINISSGQASFHDEFESGNPNYGYSASKIALNMYTFRSSKELPKNIKTFAVHPGSVETDMNPKGEQKPYDQAKKIMDITNNWKDNFNGKFMRWSGEKYPL